MTTVMVVGFKSGMTTYLYIWNIFAPSSMAASSSDSGMLLMNPLYSRTDILIPNPPYMRIRPGVFLSPSLSISDTSGYITDWKGMSMAAVYAMKSIFATLESVLAIAHAANEDMSTISATAATVMSTV